MMLGARTAAWAKSGAPLPYDAEVEWIESTGSQYIDTGIYAVNNIIVEGIVIPIAYIDINVTEIIRIIIGTDYTGSGWTFVIRQVCTEVENFFHVMFGGWWVKNTNLDVGGLTYFKYNRKVRFFTVNGKTMGTQPPSDFSSHKILIGKNMNQGFDECPSLKTVNIKIHIGDNTVRDFIPVRFTNENGETEGAMYDKVSGQLFRNAGTGAFVIGPDK